MLNASSPTRKSVLILAGVFFLSLALRFALISKGPYNLDTLNLAIKAQETLKTGRLQHLFGSGYPLTVLLGALFILVTKMSGGADPVYAVNLMSVVLSALSVALLYRIADNLFGFWAAVFASVSFSLCPIFLSLSVYGKSHAPGMFFLLLSVLFLLRFLRQPCRRDLVFSAVFFGAMGAARLQDMFLLFPAMGFGVLFGQFLEPGFPFRGGRKNLKFLAVFCLVAGGTAAAFHLPYILQKGGEYNSNVQLFWKLGFKDLYMGFFSPLLLMAGQHLVDNFTWPGLVTILTGFFLICRKNLSFGIFLLLWVFGPLFFYGNHRFIINPRFLVVILPPLVLCQGYVLGTWSLKFRTARFVMIPVFFSMLFLTVSQVYPALKFRHDHALLPDFVRWVAASVEPDAQVIVADEALFYRYYTNCRVFYRPAHPIRTTQEELDQFKQTVDALLDQNIPVYITTASLFAYDRDRHFSDFFMSQYEGELIGSHDYEDWHLGSATTQVFLFDLYRVRKGPRGMRKEN